MAGAFLSIDVQDDAARAAFARLLRVTGNLRPAFEEIGSALVASTDKRFLDSRDPGGRKWQRLARSTVLGRLRRSKNATVTGIKALVDQSILRHSIHWQVKGDSVIVGSGLKYAAIHQLGGKAGRGRKITIPARPYLGLSDDDRREVQDILARRIEAAV